MPCAIVAAWVAEARVSEPGALRPKASGTPGRSRRRDPCPCNRSSRSANSRSAETRAVSQGPQRVTRSRRKNTEVKFSPVRLALGRQGPVKRRSVEARAQSETL